MYTFTNINTNTITKANESNITKTATIITARWQACWHTTVHVTHWALSLQERKLLCLPMQVYTWMAYVISGVHEGYCTILLYTVRSFRELFLWLSILLFFTTKFTITSTVLTILANNLWKYTSVQWNICLSIVVTLGHISHKKRCNSLQSTTVLYPGAGVMVVWVDRCRAASTINTVIQNSTYLMRSDLDGE